MTCLVSILIPMYNAENTIAETIQSCLKQTHRPVEIIVVDDGSTDRSLAIVNRIANEHPTLTVVQQKRTGACAARNTAFRYASGAYIQYLDADDLLSANKVSSQLRSTSSVSAGTLFFCKTIRFTKNPADGVCKQQSIYKNYDLPEQYLIDSWRSGYSSQTACWLTSRQLIEEAGGWDEQLVKYQDFDFFCRIILKSSELLFDAEGAVYYRKFQPGSISQVYTHDYDLCSLNVIKRYSRYIQPHENAELNRVVLHNYLSFYRAIYPRHLDLRNLARILIREQSPATFLCSSAWETKITYLLLRTHLSSLFWLLKFRRPTTDY